MKASAGSCLVRADSESILHEAAGISFRKGDLRNNIAMCRYLR